ncbi:MAG: hypothetical protein IPQ15_00005 [Betaproteobacteria bacterium]|nr:hypothetical protein [Betaproteobacteria bacterium]
MTTSASPARMRITSTTAPLTGMRLNIVGEVDGMPGPGHGDFKSITIGRDPIGARHPTHSPFSFRNEAAHIFSGNTFPAGNRATPRSTFAGIVHFRNSVAGREDLRARWIASSARRWGDRGAS